MVTRMTIATHGYLLSDSTDVESLQLEVCEAIRKGGGIVTVDRVQGAPVTVIVSPGVPVLFESVPDHDGQVAQAEVGDSLDDWESYL